MAPTKTKADEVPDVEEAPAAPAPVEDVNDPQAVAARIAAYHQTLNSGFNSD